MLGTSCRCHFCKNPTGRNDAWGTLAFFAEGFFGRRGDLRMTAHIPRSERRGSLSRGRKRQEVVDQESIRKIAHGLWGHAEAARK